MARTSCRKIVLEFKLASILLRIVKDGNSLTAYRPLLACLINFSFALLALLSASYFTILAKT